MTTRSKLPEQRKQLLPILADAFLELGFRRATTAELARRCQVKENILYRHFPDKSAMFVAALEFVHDRTVATWARVLAERSGDPHQAAEHLLDYESKHLGEHGYHRIIFSALGEADEPAIRSALMRMYRGLHRTVYRAIKQANGAGTHAPSAGLRAWGILGLGTIATIGGEVGALSARRRAALIDELGRLLVLGLLHERPRKRTDS